MIARTTTWQRYSVSKIEAIFGFTIIKRGILVYKTNIWKY